MQIERTIRKLCGYPGRVAGFVVAAGFITGISMLATASPAGKSPKPSGAKSQQRPLTPQQLHASVNATLGLSASEINPLEINRTPGRALTVAVEFDKRQYTLDLWPHSTRAAGYQLKAQLADGSIVNVIPGPDRTLRGRVLESPGSQVAGSLMPDGLHAMILFHDGSELWIEPVDERVAGAGPRDHVIYRATDVIADAGTCGVDAEFEAANPIAPRALGHKPQESALAGGDIRCAELGIDADFEYFSINGSSVSNVEADVANIINAMNVQYENEVGISHIITTVIVRTAEPDPYTSSNPSTLLGEFRTEWNANQVGVQRDVAELFTGKNLSGSVIGIAYVGVICGTSGYNVVQSRFSGNFSCRTDLSSHELGHNWNAPHCSCPSNTMNPSITCTNTFSSSTRSAITNHRNSRTCLSTCELGTSTFPFVDEFPTTTLDDTLWTGIDGAVSNSLGTGEPSEPNSLNLGGSASGGDQIRSAILNANGLGEIRLGFYYQRGGSNVPPQIGEDLVVDYLLSDQFTWAEAMRLPGGGVPMTKYQQVTMEFPSDAFHSTFRFRFRVDSDVPGAADWFVDNVNAISAPLPANDNCSAGTVVPEGVYSFTSLGSSTDGPDEPTACDFNGYTHIENDVWYRYASFCNGTVTVSMCDADYNAKLAVYSGGCTSLNLLGCSDDDCASGGDGPSVSFAANSGTLYRIRVGGFEGQKGNGTLVIECVPDDPCTGDIAPQPNGDGQVNVDDLLLVINSWGTCPAKGGCAADISPDPGGDGEVNVDDLLLIINRWGACP